MVIILMCTKLQTLKDYLLTMALTGKNLTRASPEIYLVKPLR